VPQATKATLRTVERNVIVQEAQAAVFAGLLEGIAAFLAQTIR
jgi:hypothetical protein